MKTSSILCLLTITFIAGCTKNVDQNVKANSEALEIIRPRLTTWYIIEKNPDLRNALDEEIVKDYKKTSGLLDFQPIAISIHELFGTNVESVQSRLSELSGNAVTIIDH